TAGHSLCGHTACMLLGMRIANPNEGTDVDLKDERVKACVVLAAPGGRVGLRRSRDQRRESRARRPFARHGLCVPRIPGDPAWDDAVAALEGSADPLGKVESK